jgi:dTDP-4-dehydrorhamnose reductase
MAERVNDAVVLGAKGTLGVALCAELERRAWRFAALGRGECDIRDEAGLAALFERLKPSVVFNPAAYTDVDRAELEPELAYAINAQGAESVARAAAASGAVVVHYSTDFVFDGELERTYDEADRLSPQGAYARSKAAGDALVAAATPRHFILRVGCLYGLGGRNFPSSIVRRLRSGQIVRADRERLGSPTWVREVARVSVDLVGTEHYGLYHSTSQGATTWADFAREAARLLQLPETQVEGVPTAALPMKAPRPRRAVLDNRKLRELSLDTISSWQSALADFVVEELALAAT